MWSPLFNLESIIQALSQVEAEIFKAWPKLPEWAKDVDEELMVDDGLPSTPRRIGRQSAMPFPFFPSLGYDPCHHNKTTLDF